jgi:hypothetical protein
MVLGMGGHKSAFALTANQQVVAGEFIDGLAHCALADAVARGQIDFAGNGLTRLPFPRLQALQDQALDLLVQRAECWRGRRQVRGACLHRHRGILIGLEEDLVRVMSGVESYLI